MAGLQYLDASIFQMLRGSGLVFVALMKQYVLMDRLVSFIDFSRIYVSFIGTIFIITFSIC
jgi:drug/metabolite transporter (DMT)-like permease